MIPVTHPWPTIVNELRFRLGSFEKVIDQLARYDLYPSHSSLSNFSTGRYKTPDFELGAALLNLLEETPQRHVPVRARVFGDNWVRSRM